ncbi:(d)CMP kinase [Clostridium sp. BJN0001]|uniref:(d)CMP kinase n=1 Tax=Clostridium sp. BJN0001 TaxID=2930219 RepID=UPI001FD3597C|nr:(d)CMP kinase [Clostridium sp. BJN0001]
MKLKVAIDGPAGAGKSTIAKMVGKKFNLMYINTGAMYRAVALKAKEHDIKPDMVDSLVHMIKDLKMHFENDDIILNGVNVQKEITMPEISKIVSSYASIKEVRKMLVKMQRDISEDYNVIMDGRDIGTVVLKDAEFKFFLTATPEERAKRRYNELQNRDIECSYDKILNDIKKRDLLDTTRKEDPLKKADDAILIDSTNLDINGVVSKISEIIKNKMNN